MLAWSGYEEEGSYGIRRIVALLESLENWSKWIAIGMPPLLRVHECELDVGVGKFSAILTHPHLADSEPWFPGQLTGNKESC
jgi:hypothetical protein